MVIMYHPIDVWVFFRDLSRDPIPGDDYIQIAWQEMPNAYQVAVIRGPYRGACEPKSYSFTTAEQAKRAFEAYANDVHREGFKRQVSHQE
jgi:hypothetical protein